MLMRDHAVFLPATHTFITSARRLCFRRCLSVCLSVCLFLSNFAETNFQTDLHEIFREGWQLASEQMSAIRITVWLQGLFFGFVAIGRYGKCYQPTALRDAAVQGIH